MSRLTDEKLQAAREAMTMPIVAGSTLAFIGRDLLAEIDALRQERDEAVKILGLSALADDALAARVRELEAEKRTLTGALRQLRDWAAIEAPSWVHLIDAALAPTQRST